MAGTLNGSDYPTRFNALWTRCCAGASTVEGGEIFNRLRAAYDEPQRRYHTFAHIAQCLSQFDRAAGGMAVPDAVEMAIWFHDVVYVPGAPDNERRSADLFRQWAGGGFPPALIDDIDRLVMATTHLSPPVVVDECWVADVDLSSFGLPWPEFTDDSRNVRAERGDLTDAAFYPAQSRFLHSLSGRVRVFQSEFFHGLLEATARANIARLLELIDQGNTL